MSQRRNVATATCDRTLGLLYVFSSFGEGTGNDHSAYHRLGGNRLGDIPLV